MHTDRACGKFTRQFVQREGIRVAVGEFACRLLRRMVNAQRRWVDACCKNREPIRHASLLHIHGRQMLLYASEARDRAVADGAKRAAAGETIIWTNDSVVATVLAERRPKRS